MSIFDLDPIRNILPDNVEKPEDDEEDYTPTNKPFVEVDPDDASGVVESYSRLRQIQMEIGGLILNAELEKERLIDEFRETRKDMREALKDLETKYKVPPGDEYTFNVPSDEDEPGLFYRNDLDEEEIAGQLGPEEMGEGIEHTTVDTSDD